MNVFNEKDIAKDYLFYNWPQSVRFILILPSAVLAALIAPVLFYFVAEIGSNLHASWFASFIRMVQNLIMGFAFTYVAGVMAPKYQFWICLSSAIILIIILTLLFTILLLTGKLYDTGQLLYWLSATVLATIGGIGGLHSIYDKLKDDL